MHQSTHNIYFSSTNWLGKTFTHTKIIPRIIINKSLSRLTSPFFLFLLGAHEACAEPPELRKGEIEAARIIESSCDYECSLYWIFGRIMSKALMVKIHLLPSQLDVYSKLICVYTDYMLSYWKKKRFFSPLFIERITLNR